MAPEAEVSPDSVLNHKQRMKADCWVLGKIFYEMNKGFWDGDCIEDWEGITPVEQELIKSLIDYKPASRISAR